MSVCVTGATGFVGGHVARALVEGGHEVRVAFRDEDRLSRLAALQVEAVKADAMDRAAMRRAFKGCELVFHCVGYVGSSPRDRVWQLNAMSPRVAVEAAAAEDVPRVVLTSSVAGIGPVPAGEVGTEEDEYRGGGLGLVYPDAKHEGEVEALAAGARTGVEVVVVNPAYVLGVPIDRSQPGETSTRTIGNYLRGRLAGRGGRGDQHRRRARCGGRPPARRRRRASPGQRYVLGGHDISWVDLLERVADLSGVHHPVGVISAGLARAARVAEGVGMPMPVAAEGMVLMAQNWRYSSRKARRELGYRARSLDDTLRETIDWYARADRRRRARHGRLTAVDRRDRHAPCGPDRAAARGRPGRAAVGAAAAGRLRRAGAGSRRADERGQRDQGVLRP